VERPRIHHQWLPDAVRGRERSPSGQRSRRAGGPGSDIDGRDLADRRGRRRPAAAPDGFFEAAAEFAGSGRGGVVREPSAGDASGASGRASPAPVQYWIRRRVVPGSTCAVSRVEANDGPPCRGKARAGCAARRPQRVSRTTPAPPGPRESAAASKNAIGAAAAASTSPIRQSRRHVDPALQLGASVGRRAPLSTTTGRQPLVMDARTSRFPAIRRHPRSDSDHLSVAVGDRDPPGDSDGDRLAAAPENVGLMEDRSACRGAPHSSPP